MSVIERDSSLQFVGLKLHSGEAPLQEVLEWMADGGSSVLLNFGEDTGAWECSWITGGERFTGIHGLIRKAVLESVNKAFAKAVQLNPTGENNGLRSTR